jgi:hypothetical protein
MADRDIISPSRAGNEDMGKAFKIAPTDEGTLYVPRIRALLHSGDFRGARALVAEAREHGAMEPELEKLEKLVAPPTYNLSPARGFDRSAEVQWMRDHAEEYRGEWVALIGSELLGHSPELGDLMKHLRAEAPEAPALLQYIED